MSLLDKLKVPLYYQRRLKKVQERASLKPENLFIQVRMGDLLAKLKRKKEAVAVYELAAQQFIQKDLFAHAIALKKIIFRLEPPRNEREQMNLLERLYDQMLICREKASMAQEAPAMQTVSPPSPGLLKRGGGNHCLNPRPSSSLLLIATSEKSLPG